jgi:hypothetical protein
MTRVYFHCSNSDGVQIGEFGTAVGNLAEARDYATCVVQSLITARGPEDWRDWILHASDELDVEIFAMPFASMLGKPN